MNPELKSSSEAINSYVFAATVLLLAVSLLNAKFIGNQSLQHLPTVIALVWAMVAGVHRRLSVFSFGCLAAFTWLHTLGARYLYSNVPYDEWAKQLLGMSISEHFCWERNHYDRVVHFMLAR